MKENLSKTLLPQEDLVVKTLKKELRKSKKEGTIENFENFINGIVTATRIIKYDIGTLPSDKYLEELGKILWSLNAIMYDGKGQLEDIERMNSRL